MKTPLAGLAAALLFTASCAQSSRSWTDDLLAGKAYDVMPRGLRLMFSRSGHEVDVRQGPGSPEAFVGRVGLWQWRIDGAWLVFLDESGRVHDRLSLKRITPGGLETARGDGTIVRLESVGPKMP